MSAVACAHHVDVDTRSQTQTHAFFGLVPVSPPLSVSSIVSVGQNAVLHRYSQAVLAESAVRWPKLSLRGARIRLA